MKLKNNSRGVTPITIVFYVIVFVFVWALFLGDFLGDQLDNTVTQNNLTGVEAFGFYFIPVIIFIALIIFVMAYMSMGGGG